MKRKIFLSFLLLGFSHLGYSQTEKIAGKWIIEDIFENSDTNTQNVNSVDLNGLLSLYSLTKGDEVAQSFVIIDESAISMQNKLGEVLITSSISKGQFKDDKITIVSEDDTVFKFIKLDKERIQLDVNNATYILSRSDNTIFKIKT